MLVLLNACSVLTPPPRLPFLSSISPPTFAINRFLQLFYVQEANGDVKRAFSAAENDLAWEDTTPGPIRTAPVQRWINGEAGL
jgi:hypothetical protein